jgi:hypothetical protein
MLYCSFYEGEKERRG